MHITLNNAGARSGSSRLTLHERLSTCMAMDEISPDGKCGVVQEEGQAHILFSCCTFCFSCTGWGFEVICYM